MAFLTRCDLLMAKWRKERLNVWLLSVGPFQRGGLSLSIKWHYVNEPGCYKERWVGSGPPCLCLPEGGDEWGEGVTDLGTFIHTKFACVGNHTRRPAAHKVSKPPPKQLAPLSMKVIMNVTHLVALKQSPQSDSSRKPIGGEENQLAGVYQ